MLRRYQIHRERETTKEVCLRSNLTLNSAPLILRPHPGQLPGDEVGARDSVVERKILGLAEVFG